MMNDFQDKDKLLSLQERICSENDVSSDVLQNLLEVVEDYTDSHRPHGLQDKLLDILKEDFSTRSQSNEG